MFRRDRLGHFTSLVGRGVAVLYQASDHIYLFLSLSLFDGRSDGRVVAERHQPQPVYAQGVGMKLDLI